MIQWFDDKVFKSKFLLIFIMLLIALPLVMWRMAGEFSGGAKGNVLAKINDTPIYSNDFQSTVSQVRTRLKPLADINPDLVTDALVEKQAMDELTSRILMGQLAEDSDMLISDEQVMQQISSMTDFIVEGKFDKEAYLERLRNAGFMPKAFEARVRSLKTIEQLQEALMDSEFVSVPENKRLVALTGETRDIGYLRIPAAHFSTEDDAVEEKDIQSYYDDNKNNFLVSESAKFEYIELNRDDIAAKIDVSEEAIQQAYESRQADFSIDPEWKARHILLEVSEDASEEEVASTKEQAESLIIRLQGGESFADLATEFSSDIGSAAKGGDLGFFSKGMMVAPFEKMVASLSIDEISSPVKTRFGWHIIQLTDKKEGSTKPLEQVRARLVTDLQAAEAEEMFFDQRDLLGTVSFENPGTLGPTAEALSLSIKETAFINAGLTQGLFSDARLKKAAFSDEVLLDKNNSEVIEVSDSLSIVLRVNEHRPSHTKALNEVRDEIITALNAQVIKARAEALGEEIKAGIVSGDSAEDVAKQHDLDWQRLGAIGRNSSVLDREMQNVAFSLRLADDSVAVAGVSLDNGDYALVQLFEVYPGELSDDLMSSQKERIQSAYARSEMEAVIVSLKAQSNISYAKENE